MGSAFSSPLKKGEDLGWGSPFSHSPNQVAIVFYKKDGVFVRDATWPMVFFKSGLYQGDFNRFHQTPWLRDLLLDCIHYRPKGLIDPLIDTPTTLISNHCKDHSYDVVFTASLDGKFILCEVVKY